MEKATKLCRVQRLSIAADQSNKIKIEQHERRLVELVASAPSMSCGKAANESEFRVPFSCIDYLSVSTRRVRQRKTRDIKFRVVDTLLVETGPKVVGVFAKDLTFAYVSKATCSQPPHEDRLNTLTSAIIAVEVVGLVTADVLPLVTAGLLAALVMVAKGCLAFSSAARTVKLYLITTITTNSKISKGLRIIGAAPTLVQFIMKGLETSVVWDCSSILIYLWLCFRW